MSNVSPAAPAAPAAVEPAPAPAPKVGPVSVAPPVRDNLPTSANIKPNPNHSADGFFEKHVAVNPAVAKALAAKGVAVAPPPSEAGAPAAVAPGAAPAPAAPDPAVEPAKGSLIGKLTAKAKPAVSAAPAEGQPAVSPLDGLTLDQKYSPAAHESFGKLKTFASGLQDQLNAARETERQLKAQLDAAKAGTVAPSADVARLQTLEAENKTLSDRLAIADLREHPKFQAEFLGPQAQALQEASTLLASAGVAGVDVAGLLSRPRAEFGKAVSEAASKLSDFDKTEFAENMRKAWNLGQQASAALSKSRELNGALRSQTETSQKQAFERTWGRAAGHVAEHIVELDVPDNATPEDRTSIEQYNAAYKGLRTVAEQRAFGPASAEVVAENAIKSAAYDFHINQALPKLLREVDGLLNLNRKLAGELNAIRGRNPNYQISGAASPQSGGAGPNGELSLAQLSAMSHADAAAALAPRRG